MELQEENNNESTFTKEHGYLVDKLDELQDMSWSDSKSLSRYRTLQLKQNDPNIELTLEEDNERKKLQGKFKNKIVTSARWNKFQNALMNMQIFIKTEVEDYVDKKQEEMQEDVDRFDYKGLYSESTVYEKNNFVSFDDGAGLNTYIATKSSVGKLPINSDYWRKLTIKGDRGERGVDGLGLKFQGEYDPNRTYMKDEGVQYGGLMFASMMNNNIGNEPDMTTKTEYWERVMNVVVTVSKMVGIRTVGSSASNVNFMTGQIKAFNPNVDSLEVYYNSNRLTENYDYKINPNNRSIDKVEGVWEGTTDNPAFFEFVVTKNTLNNLVFGDGSSIQPGTISRDKLNVDMQNELDYLKGHIENFVYTGPTKPDDTYPFWFEVIE